MAEAGLTSRDRVNRMFARREHDRVPRHDSFWADTIRRWQREGLEGGAGDVLKQLDTDFAGVGSCVPVPFPGRRQIVREDEQTQVITDAWGGTARFWKGRSGTPEHIGFECTSREIWERKFKPLLLERAMQMDLEAAKKNFAAGRNAGKWCFITGFEAFEVTRRLMGDETTLMAMAEDPDWVCDVSRTHCDVTLRNYDALIAAGVRPDGLWIYGDMAFNHATLCSPQMYRELIWPDHKRLADWAHAHGMKFIFHTDGDVNGVLDLYVGAGFDCLQPVEAKANLDIRKLCPAYGRRLAFFGNIDVMVMGTNDRGKIEHEIRTKFAAGMAARGYAYHSDHSVPPTVSWPTYRFIIELVHRFGRYR